MKPETRRKKRSSASVLCILLAALLLLSLMGNVWLYVKGCENNSFLQQPSQIGVTLSGILRNNLDFAQGAPHTFTYDMTDSEYPQLNDLYHIDTIAGGGSEFDRALRLMDAFAPRLHHKSDYDNHVPMDALSLLAYSLDQPKNGINCRAKAQIFNEICLANGIYARKVWLLPYSPYDGECHVVNEVWDAAYRKWIMLDISNNEYWVNEDGKPLSILEIRSLCAARKFCTPVHPSDSLDDLQALREKYQSDILYIMKNLVILQYCAEYAVGESETFYTLLPAHMEAAEDTLILSPASCLIAPDV